MIDVSVIVINYNSSTYTIECVDSILKNTSNKISFEIIIVDNHSDIDDFLNLENGITSIPSSQIKIFRNSTNSGFGGGNMIGYKHARGKYLAFINNDVLLRNDCLAILMKNYKSNKKIGVCGPTTYTDNRKILPTLDFYTSPLKFYFGRKIYSILKPDLYRNRYRKLEDLTFGDFVSGSFMFMSKDSFESIGGFDENIFLYHEETDICKRLNLIGLEAACIPEAECFHYHGASTKKSLKIRAELKRSLLYITRKHYGFAHYICMHTFMKIKYFIKSLFSPKHKFLYNVIKGPIKLNQSTRVSSETRS